MPRLEVRQQRVVVLQPVRDVVEPDLARHEEVARGRRAVGQLAALDHVPVLLLEAAEEDLARELEQLAHLRLVAQRRLERLLPALLEHGLGGLGGFDRGRRGRLRALLRGLLRARDLARD